MSGVASGSGLEVTGAEGAGKGFVYTGHLEESLPLLSLEQKPVHGELKISPYARPEYGKLGKEVPLLVNHFRLQMPEKLMVHHYVVKILQNPKAQQFRGRGRGQGRGRRGHTPQPHELKLKKDIKAVFWDAIRRFKETREIREIDEAVFDDFENAWLSYRYNNLNCVVPHPDEKCQRSWEVQVVFQFNCSYAININASIAETAHMSELFLKSLITQRVRYMPKSNDHPQYVEFAKSWEFAVGSMFKFHRDLYGSVEDNKRKVFPGVRAWIGLNASAKPGEDGTYINLGLANRLYYFPEMNLITFIREVIIEDRNQCIPDDDTFKKDLQNMGMSATQRNRLSFMLEDLRVKTSMALIIDFGMRNRDGTVKKPPDVFLGQRHYKIGKLVNWTARTYFPETPQCFGSGHSMEEIYHYKETPLRFPNLPLVEVKLGNTSVLQPLEVLLVHDSPQQYAKQLEMKQQRRYIQKVTKTPSEYKEETDDLIRRLHIMGPHIPFLQNYGVNLDPNWTSCTGRVLDLPVIRDVEGKPAKLLKDYKYVAKELTYAVEKIWVDVVITHCPRTGDPAMENERAQWFYNNLIKCMKDRGLSVVERNPQVYSAQAYSTQETFRHPTLEVEPESHVVPRDGIPTMAAVIEDSKKRFNSSEKAESRRHLMLFFTTESFDFYGRIKFLGNSRLGIATQVVRKETCDRAHYEEGIGKKAIFYNLALKINAKLGGVNMKVDLPLITGKTNDKTKPPTVMYVGIDVTHPGTETRANAAPIDISLAAMVGSTDYWGTTYNTRIYAQMVAKETVECFDRQFVDLIWEFQKENNAFPKHVVIYRDGVSNSEMLRTASLEIGWIKGSWEHVCSKAGENRPPPPTYTYIVVQKRHRTRFVAPTKDEKTFENPLPGTVVDKKVVSPKWNDFYLASHYGSVGTSRIAHYTIVYDEWKLSVDSIHAMTYRLAFLNARCRMPCALPAPVVYAHLACDQAKEMYRAFVKSYPMRDLPILGENPSTKQQQEFDLCRIERKQKIEDNLGIHGNYPGMHFV